MKFLCVPCDSPMKLQTVGSARGRLAVGRLLLSGVRLRDGDADQSLRDTARSVARRPDWSRRWRIERGGAGTGSSVAEPRRPTGTGTGSAASGTRCPFPAMMAGIDGAVETRAASMPSQLPSGGRPLQKRGSGTFPRSFVRWPGPASRISPVSEGSAKWTRRSSTRRVIFSGCSYSRCFTTWAPREASGARDAPAGCG